MTKVKTVHVCRECGWESAKWVGQCRQCHAWGTLEETLSLPTASTTHPGVTTSSMPPTAAIKLDSVGTEEAAAHTTGIGEFDRVLGGGIVPGSVILLSGEPGVGKSTLLLDIAARYARMAQLSGRGPVLYVTGEESAGQVRRRAERIGAIAPGLLLAAESDAANVLWHLEQTRASLLIVDSVQTLSTGMVDGQPGSVGQVKAVANLITQEAKKSNVPALLVGHVTKDGSLAGPRTLEHLVDVVCQFEGDRTTPLRMLRAVKNRYGATDEVGCFILDDVGIQEVPDPSTLFTSGSKGEAPGSCVTVTLEGHRPLVTEIQGLVAPGTGGSPRRATSGVDYSRVSMILAVMQAHVTKAFRVPQIQTSEVYVSTVGGARAVEPASDLAVSLAVYSSARRRNVLPGTIVIGEVGLTGEVRGCAGLSRRITEAARLGWRRALVPSSQFSDLRIPQDMDVIPVRDLNEAIHYVVA